MKLYLAGAEGERYDTALLSFGATNRLASYFYIKHVPSPLFDLLIDSGGFTARKTGVPINVKTYAEFLNKLKIKNAFNLDTNSVEESLENQNYLEAACSGTYIIPIYHYSEYEDAKYRNLIEEYVKKYPYIAIGGVASTGKDVNGLERFFNFVFSYTRDKTKVHGLGITKKDVMIKYPFYSVDSTSWLVSARYGGSSVEKNKLMLKYQNKNQHYLERCKKEVKHFLNLEREITNIWTARGVVWQEFRK